MSAVDADWAPCVAAAAALEAAVMALAPDDALGDGGPAFRAAAGAAATLSAECAARGDGPLALAVAAAARVLTLSAEGQVQPHHAQWRLASALATVRQAVEAAAAGQALAPVALVGVRYELETLLPPEQPPPPPPPDEPPALVPVSALVRRPPGRA